MAVAQVFRGAAGNPAGNAVALMDSGAGLARIAAVEFVRGQDRVCRRRMSFRQSWITGQAFASVYERIGGAVTIDHLLGKLLSADRWLARRVDHSCHASDRSRFDKTGAEALFHRMDGRAEALYARERPPPAAPAPFGFPIGSADRDAWLTCMRGALEEKVLDEAARADLDLALSRTGCATRPAECEGGGPSTLIDPHSSTIRRGPESDAQRHALIESIYPQIRSASP